MSRNSIGKNERRGFNKLNRTMSLWNVWLISLVMLIPSFALGAISTDANVSGDRTTSASTISTPSFSTGSGNELLLAFVATGGPSSSSVRVSSIAGAGLTWTRVARANSQRGTSEIWRAFASSKLTNVSVTATLSKSTVSSITVVSFAGADTSGVNGSGAIGATAIRSAASGAPSASLVTTRNNSWVFGVGNDWDGAVARTLGAGQTMVHQYFTTVNDTFWIQRSNSLTSLAGTTVTINDTAPTADRFNLAICEILPATGVVPQTWSITGTIAPSSGGNGATVSLSGAASATTTANSSGVYAFTGLANGSYTVTPSRSGYTFSLPSQSVTVSGANVTGVNFTATAQTYSISGNIAGGSGATVAVNGSSSASVTADGSGNYTVAGLSNGSYVVTPSKVGFTFTQSSRTVLISGANVGGVNFTASIVAVTYSISGTISPTAGGSGATVALTGASTASVAANSSGGFTFSGLANGNYTVTPSNVGYSFAPVATPVTINGADMTGVDFSASVFSGANTFYVDKLASSGCSDSFPGSQVQPWCTVGKAVNVLKPGDTVIVMPGVYNESLIPHSGSAGSFITYVGQPGAVLDGTGLTHQAIDILNVSYVRVTGFEVTNIKVDRPAGNSVNIHGTSHHIELSNMMVHDNWNGIIMQDSANNITITNSEVHHQRYGVGFENTVHDVTIDSVSVHDSSELYIGPVSSPTYPNGDGFSGDGGVTNVTITNSEAYNNEDGGFDMTSENFTCENCKAHHNRYGFRVWQGNVGTLINVLSYGNVYFPIQIGSNSGTGTRTIYNSTFVGASGDHGYAMEVVSKVNVILRNNIFVDYTSGIFSAALASRSENYDLFYSPGHSIGFTIGANSLNADPLFVNKAGGDLHLQVASPAIDKGTALPQVTTDLDNVARPQGAGFDMGAFELAVP